PSGLTTCTSTKPGVFRPEVIAVSLVVSVNSQSRSIPPNLSLQPLMKFCPRIVTSVPPDRGPLAGDTDLINGGAKLAIDDLELRKRHQCQHRRRSIRRSRLGSQ